MKNECILFVDTTNNYCYISIFKNKKVLLKTKIQVNKNVTDIIVDAIFDLLKQTKIKQQNITTIVINVGPGSFTGVKIGVVVAKTWKLVNPKVVVKTTNSLLLQLDNGTGLSVIDAKSNKYYLAVYKNSKAIIKPKLIDASKLNVYKNKYKKIPFVINNTDNMYDNFVKYSKSFQKINDINKLEPLYLKKPV